MILRLENIGEGEARVVKAKLEGLEGSGNTNAFVGRLDKDDDAPAVFTFVPEKAGEQAVTLLVEYEDDLGEHQLRENLTFNVLGDNSIIPSVKVPILILIIPILIVVSIVRKKKGRMGSAANEIGKKNGNSVEREPESKSKSERGV